MGTKNKDSKKKSKKKDKKHKKSKKVSNQDKELLEINNDKSKDVPIEVKKQEVDDFMAS